MGIGAICHTINPRLHDEQIVYIANHAGDRLLFADAAFSDLVARIVPRCPGIARVVLIEGQSFYESLATFIEGRTEEHTSELQSLMRTSYAVFCLKKKRKNTKTY